MILLMIKSTAKILKDGLLQKSLTNLNTKLVQFKVKLYTIANKTSKDGS